MGLGECTALTTISAFGNLLERIFDDLLSMESLLHLSLSNNRLAKLPICQWNLPNLLTLDLSNNLLVTLPEEMSSLTSLIDLNLAFNFLLQLFPIYPDKLQKLNVAYNRLHRYNWPTSEQLPQLNNLVLSGNRLCNVPEFVPELTKLRYLDLSNNLISNLPKNFSKLTNLETLLLTLNRLDKVDPICDCVLLKNLDLAHNNIRHFPHNFGSVSNVVDIDITGNNLKDLPTCMSQLYSLQQLKVCSNELWRLPNDLPDSIWVSSMNNRVLHKKGFSKLEKLATKYRKLYQNTRHSSRSLITRLSQKSLKDVSIEKVVAFGWAEMKGRRPDQQDTISCIPNFMASPNKYLFSIFDGHGGSKASQMAASYFHVVFAEKLLSGNQVTNKLRPEVVKCMKETFGRLHHELVDR